MNEEAKANKVNYTEKRWDLIAAIVAIIPLLVTLLRSFMVYRKAGEKV